jgi:glycerate kinase
MSSASGLHLLRPDQYDPSATTTFGTGELIRAAVAMGCREVLLGIGGSATTDGGIGCAQACGLPVLLAGGEPTYDTEPLCGRDVEKVVLVKHGRGSPVDGVKITVACDVTNPLFGTNGAAMVYGPQKGGTPAQLRELDAALKKLATRQNALDVANTPGAGAAGGLGFGMMAFFGATLVPGAKLVIDATGLRDRLAGADLCVTVEGRADATSSAGKTTHAVAALCKELGVPCVVLAGGVGEVDGLLAAGATAVLSVCDGPMSLGQATAEAGRLLGRAAEMVTRLRLAAAVGPGRQTSG